MPASRVAQVAWPALIAHPRFREAVERNASLILAHKDRYTPVLFWMTGDTGRASTLTRALIRHAREGAVSVGDVVAMARVRSTGRASRSADTILAPGAGPHKAAPLLTRSAGAISAVARRALEATAKNVRAK